MDVDPLAVAGFGRAAPAYERGRPGYPADALAWLTKSLQLRRGRTVVDLAAGTGKLSRQLVQTGATVVGVEPLDEMRRLLERIAGVEPLAGTAEAIPLPDASADAVTVAHAFHWFRTGAALDEIHRVLRPRGALALLWNRLDRTDPLAGALEAIIQHHRGHAPRDTGRWRLAFEGRSLFTVPELRTFPNAQELDADALADRAASESSIAILPERRRSKVLDEVRALTTGTVTLHYVTEVYVCRRRS